MANDASQALGAPEVAGTLVSPRGLTKTSQPGWKPHTKGDALVRVPRTDVQSVELDRGKVLSHLKLTFADGLVWEFEIPRANRKGAALGGNVT